MNRSDPLRFLESARVDALLARMSAQRVLVLGDVMLDCYLWGDIQRISPEAPVAVVEADRETQRLGGAANVASNVNALGAEARLVGVVGNDVHAARLRELLQAQGMTDAGLVASDRRTTRKTRVIARHQQVLRIDHEDARELRDALLERARQVALEEISRATACIISDYGKGVITPPLLREVLGEAAARGIPVCVDPKETHFFEYAGVDLITPNTKEASVARGRRITDLRGLLEAGHELRSRLDCRAVLITRGEHGMALFERDRPVTGFRAIARDVFDVTGAGDTVVSVAAVALGAGATIEEAAALANHAASLVVREVGTAAVTAPELAEAVARDRARGRPFPLRDEPEDPAGSSSPENPS